MSFCYYEISVFNITREFVELTLINNLIGNEGNNE